MKTIEQERTSSISVVVAGEALFTWKPLQKCLAKELVFIVVRCADNPADVFFCCQRVIPCVLLVEQAFLDKADPVEFANRINFGRSIHVLIRMEKDEQEAVERYLRMGCAGSVGLGISAQALALAVRTVARGQLWADRKTISAMLRSYVAAGNPGRLTPREAEILALIARGLRNKEIAEKLFLSFETVRWHIRSLYAKIGVHDRVSAALYGMEQLVDRQVYLPLPDSSDDLKTGT